jgi:Membrane protein implicated in regulation of membrane protease activity
VDVISSFAWIGWLVLILVFITIEMLSLDFVFLMIAVGSVGGLLSGLFGLPWWWQLAIAAALSLLLLFTIRPPLLRLLRRGGDPALSNVPALLGTEGRVVQTVSTQGGLVKLANGETWTARLSPGFDSLRLDAGELVLVASIDGATAVVIPSERSTSNE